MISDNLSVGKTDAKKIAGYSVYKTAYFFAFPVVAFLSGVFALGLLFESAEGGNARLVCGIVACGGAALCAIMYFINSLLKRDWRYETLSFPFMKKINPLAIFLLLTFLLITLFPFYVVVINSIKTSPEANGLGFTFFPQQGMIVDNYKILFSNTSNLDVDLVASFFYSLFYATVPVGVGTLVSAFAAYGFAKLNYPGRAFVYNFMIFTLMVPGCVSMASSYVMYDALGWTKGTALSLPLIIPACFGGIGCVMFLREFFKGIPDGMLEAARIDGCGKLKIFWKIMIPLGMPAIIAQLVLGFIGAYNDFQSALIYIKYPENYTVQLALQIFNKRGADNAQIAAAAVFGVVPLLLLYVAFQKKIISGISFSSGLKG